MIRPGRISIAILRTSHPLAASPTDIFMPVIVSGSRITNVEPCLCTLRIAIGPRSFLGLAADNIRAHASPRKVRHLFGRRKAELENQLQNCLFIELVISPTRPCLRAVAMICSGSIPRPSSDSSITMSPASCVAGSFTMPCSGFPGPADEVPRPTPPPTQQSERRTAVTFLAHQPTGESQSRENTRHPRDQPHLRPAHSKGSSSFVRRDAGAKQLHGLRPD